MKHTLLLLLLLPLLRSASQEPTANPTVMQFTNVTAYGLTLSFTPSLADGFLVLKSDRFITDIPMDSVTYHKGEGLGNSKVMYAGPLSTVNIREMLEGTKYYFAVFAYNGSGAAVNYKQTLPLLDSVISTPYDATAYFSSVDSSSGTFLADLHSLINNHTMVSYTSYKYLIIPVIYERDTFVNGLPDNAVVDCEYSDVTTTYVTPFDFMSEQYNREHSLPKSWMLTGGNTNNADGSDYHNLLLTRDVPNQVRSNHPLGVVATVLSSFGNSKYGYDSNGNPVFEPQDKRKGDAARNMFYQMLCYNGNGGNWGLDNLLTEAPNQDQEVLKLWNAQDPPDKFERTRDEYIYSVQHNHNPFIAHPDWVNCINFDSLLKTSLCGALSPVGEITIDAALEVFPNPAKDVVNITVTTEAPEPVMITLCTIAGQPVRETEWTTPQGMATQQLSTVGLSAGTYFLKVVIRGRQTFRKVLLVN